MSLPSRHPADNPLPLPPPAPAGATAKRPTKTKGRRRRAGEGSIYQRADGRWVAAVRLPDGARRYFYAKTQREAIDKLRASQRALDDGLPLGDGRLTVERFLHTWLESVRGAIRPSTYSSYELAVRRLLPRIGRIRLAALDPAAVQHAYTALQDAGLAASSVRLTHRVLHAALKQAVRWGLVGRNVTDLVRAPRPEAREMRTLTAEQLAALFSATETAGDRLHALWVLLATTGLRLGEALGLRWEDVDLTGGRLTVTRALQRQRGQGMQFVEPKSAAGRRTVFLSQVAVAALRAHRARQLEERLAAGPLWEDIGLVFTTTRGTPLDVQRVDRHFRRALARAGLPRVRVHDLRHTAATLLLAGGTHPKVVQELLGHATIAITLGTYAHTVPAMHRQAVAHFDALFARQRREG
jgi:integrase